MRDKTMSEPACCDTHLPQSLLEENACLLNLKSLIQPHFPLGLFESQEVLSAGC